ncbi:hypothetical protein Atai01_08980 [Amycolatopsis taiwanensis]|uniref:DUF4878 domain-containing protein n=2 Tax=Amycolatopsis taiwanensis TaxID=342230 RepID=A0A9W6QU74_9PSEU|nr:hypothetical protein Atai01_08980 [Amycolatopsis taiwanensis]
MSYPPQPGQPGHSGGQYPNANPGQWGPSGGAYPGAGGPPQFGQTWPTPGQQSPGAYPGMPGGMPPKRKTGLIVGIALAAVVVVGGGITAAVLLTGGKGDTQQAAPPSTEAGQPAPGSTAASSPRSTSPSSGSGSKAFGQPTPEALQQKIIDMYTTHNAQKMSEILCSTPSPEMIQQVQQTLDTFPPDGTYSPAKPPEIDAPNAKGTLTIHVEGNGKSGETSVPIMRVGVNWCAED